MRGKILIGLIFVLAACAEEEGSISSSDQLDIDIGIIDAYLANNPGAPSDITVKDATGIRLRISEVGLGPLPPNVSNDLKVNYTGRLLSTGQIFDSKKTIYLKLSDGIIAGWKIGLALLPKGSRAKLYIPSGYAYGSNGRESIPPNANLVFDTHLESVEPTLQQRQRLLIDVDSIDAYVADNEISSVVAHESGLRYVFNQIAAGSIPTLYSKVKIKYVGKLLADSSVFMDEVIEPTAAFSSRVANFPHGVLIGLQVLSVGSKVTLYVPSVLAAGTQTYPALGTNKNAFFEIELIDIIE